MLEKLEQTLETYTVEAEIGRDELTIIYRGKRKKDGLPVAIQVVAPQFTFDTYFMRRFKDAANRTLKLEHPNILKTYDIEDSTETCYLVREWTQAQTLAEYMAKKGPLTSTEGINLTRQIASALDYAHAKAITHGDLNDSNIFIEDGLVKVADFGLLQTMIGTSLVKKGFAVGNSLYLSPERVKGESPSRRADLYALGVLCYQMLSGQPPFSGEPATVLHAQIYEPAEEPHLLNPNIRPEVSEVIMRMLSKGLELRHNTGAEFVRALQVAADGSAPIKKVTNPRLKSSKGITASKLAWGKFIFGGCLVAPLLGITLASGFWLIINWGNLSSSETTVAAQPNIENITPIPDFNFGLETATTTPTPPPNIDAVATTGLITPSPISTPTVALLNTLNTPSPFPTLPGAVVNPSAPFSNLILARGISTDSKPQNSGNIFAPTQDPIYLFFDYENMPTGATWKQEWQWDDIILQTNEAVWPETYGPSGTAWIYYSPALGFNPGPYSVSLAVNGEEVASITFIVQVSP